MVKISYEKSVNLAKLFLIWAYTNLRCPIYSLQKNHLYFNGQKSLAMSCIFWWYRFFFHSLSNEFCRSLKFWRPDCEGFWEQIKGKYSIAWAPCWFVGTRLIARKLSENWPNLEMIWTMISPTKHTLNLWLKKKICRSCQSFHVPLFFALEMFVGIPPKMATFFFRNETKETNI